MSPLTCALILSGGRRDADAGLIDGASHLRTVVGASGNANRRDRVDRG